ncbi:MAG: hypothetical protein J0H31_01605, partial [Alphaproteobacteria bacterium]|nr:hypothetical protein [Alphaproteobacteria bacterium]
GGINHYVGQEKLGFPPGNRAPQPRQEMQLAEHPGKRRLASLVRPGHHDHPFRTVEVEIVAYDALLFADKLGRQSQVETLAGEACGFNLAIRRMRLFSAP